MAGYFEVTVEDGFSACHSVLLPGGSYEPPHVHEWRVWVTFRAATLNEAGFVVDFVEAQAALRQACGELDGGDLNAHTRFATGASAERVAHWLAERMATLVGESARVHRVSVTEAAGCVAAYYPEDAGTRGRGEVTSNVSAWGGVSNSASDFGF